MEKQINTGIDKEKILKIRNKLINKEINPETEEATKQWLIVPVLVALGYDPYSSDVIPEFTLDVGTRKGEKVDYALQINNQPVCLVECKQLNVTLSEKHISQLYRYFTISNVHIAILTNGNDYWFFTDSQKENIMDLEPYYKVKLSDASDDELDKFELYSKEMIQYAEVNNIVQYERFQMECKELAHDLRTNNAPAWLLDTLIQRVGITSIDRPTLAEFLYTEIQSEFSNYKFDKKEKKNIDTQNSKTSLGLRMKMTMDENKKNISKIKINHEYVYNDYSDGDWRFHNMDYAVIFGTKYSDMTGRKLLLTVIEQLFKHGKIQRDKILKEEQFDGQYKINAKGGFRGEYHLEEYDVYISTSYGIDQIIKFIERVLSYAGVPDYEVKVSFKE